MEEQFYIKNVFQKGTLTREDYTHAWIELITKLEKSKSASFSPKI